MKQALSAAVAISELMNDLVRDHWGNILIGLIFVGTIGTIYIGITSSI